MTSLARDAFGAAELIDPYHSPACAATASGRFHCAGFLHRGVGLAGRARNPQHNRALIRPTDQPGGPYNRLLNAADSDALNC